MRKIAYERFEVVLERVDHVDLAVRQNLREADVATRVHAGSLQVERNRVGRSLDGGDGVLEGTRRARYLGDPWFTNRTRTQRLPPQVVVLLLSPRAFAH